MKKPARGLGLKRLAAAPAIVVYRRRALQGTAEIEDQARVEIMARLAALGTSYETTLPYGPTGTTA
ncbi:MAG TPA: hypothetical protein VHY20_15005 [Pirellulales bacterium]|jgi:hypothetical protein|nr:hypothetical protein [Pirellulales bacterium]